jgi:hypothetical protein
MHTNSIFDELGLVEKLETRSINSHREKLRTKQEKHQEAIRIGDAKYAKD